MAAGQPSCAPCKMGRKSVRIGTLSYKNRYHLGQRSFPDFGGDAAEPIFCPRVRFVDALFGEDPLSTDQARVARTCWVVYCAIHSHMTLHTSITLLPVFMRTCACTSHAILPVARCRGMPPFVPNSSPNQSGGPNPAKPSSDPTSSSILSQGSTTSSSVPQLFNFALLFCFSSSLHA